MLYIRSSLHIRFYCFPFRNPRNPKQLKDPQRELGISRFLTISVFRRKGISNGSKRNDNFARIFLGTNAIQETWSGSQRCNEAATRQEGAPRGVCAPPPSWAPRSSTDLLLSPIYTLIPWKHPGEPRNHFSTAATFCTREIPYWGLFRWSARGGFDHGDINTIASSMMCE